MASLITQGTLNRLRAHIVVASFTNLNITPSYMTKNFVTVSLDDNFTDQLPTATGVVNAPVPYSMATVSVGLIRSQSLAQSWLTQAGTNTILGTVSIYPDTSSFDTITLTEVAIAHIQPGPFDGMDATVNLTLRGVYQLNNDLWNGL